MFSVIFYVIALSEWFGKLFDAFCVEDLIKDDKIGKTLILIFYDISYCIKSLGFALWIEWPPSSSNQTGKCYCNETKKINRFSSKC